MADSSRKTAGPKGSATRAKSTRSDSEALIALAAEEGAKARAPSAAADLADHGDRGDHEELLEENRRSLEAFVQANAAVLDGMAALSAEMLDFGNKRLNANIERSQSLAGCEDMEQAFRVQTEFFESAVRQYLDQANNVMTIMATISRSVWTPLEPKGDEAGEPPSGASG